MLWWVILAVAAATGSTLLARQAARAGRAPSWLVPATTITALAVAGTAGWALNQIWSIYRGIEGVNPAEKASYLASGLYDSALAVRIALAAAALSLAITMLVTRRRARR